MLDIRLWEMGAKKNSKSSTWKGDKQTHSQTDYSTTRLNRPSGPIRWTYCLWTWFPTKCSKFDLNQASFGHVKVCNKQNANNFGLAHILSMEECVTQNVFKSRIQVSLSNIIKNKPPQAVEKNTLELLVFQNNFLKISFSYDLSKL